MPTYQQDEIDEFEDLEFQNTKEARLNYLIHGQPLNPRHQRYLQEKNKGRQESRGRKTREQRKEDKRVEEGRQEMGGRTASAHQETLRQEMYQQQNCGGVSNHQARWAETSHQEGDKEAYNNQPFIGQESQPGPSTYQGLSEAWPKPQATWGSRAYSLASTDEHSLPEFDGYSDDTPSTDYTQDGSEYYGQSDQNPQNKQSSTMKTMMQQKDNHRNIQIWSSKGWQGLKGVLDNGTEENWISKKVCDRLKLPVRDGLRKVYTTFNGASITSVASTEVTWCLDGWGNTEVTVFRVAEGQRAPFDVLFGRNIISSGEVDFWGQQNPIQILTGPDVQAGEQQEIVQNQSTVQSETASIEEQRRHKKEQLESQEKINSEKGSKGTRNDGRRTEKGRKHKK